MEVICLLLTNNDHINHVHKLCQRSDRRWSGMLGICELGMENRRGTMEPRVNQNGKGAREFVIGRRRREARSEGEKIGGTDDTVGESSDNLYTCMTLEILCRCGRAGWVWEPPGPSSYPGKSPFCPQDIPANILWSSRWRCMSLLCLRSKREVIE